MDSIWQQHKSFILKILAGLGVCLVCWIVGASLSGPGLSDLESTIRTRRAAISSGLVPDPRDTEALTDATEKLRNRILFTAQHIGETRKGEDLRRGIIESLLRRFGSDSQAIRDRYLNMARQNPVACIIDLAGKAREYLVTRAGQNSVLLVEDVGYDKLSMDAGQFDRYLITLELIVTVAETAVECRVREIKDVLIGSPPGGRFEGEDVFVREYPISVKLRGSSAALIAFLERLNDPGRMIVLTRLGSVTHDQQDRDPDMLIADFDLSALRIDPDAGIQE